MDISSVSRISGLTRGQIDQAISRWTITPHARSEPGKPRRFTAADCFKFAVVGELHRMGLAWPAIREAVWAATLTPEVDPETFEQIEIFPGASRFVEAVLVIRNFNQDELPEARFVERADLPKIGSEATIVLPASKIASRILAELAAGE